MQRAVHSGGGISVPRDAVTRLRKAIDALTHAPRPPGVKKLVGGRGEYRIRVGHYRIVYELHDDVLVIEVISLGHRREIYRRER
ncbi:type II toxin-antitoxin system RelE/ParE family toxin [Nocardiopsis gilva YIM 90087]|uniref:Type II toxin-antitoxin system RelE/ParE family toxin n=1 Tax=Nocardiopsis gilva YIM 90087 TaxID=1235441 RepID=A0A223SAM4_9ACTN|nr:type II toxin-antitoxin system RelE/ParE family toxin [Nocardiopsis gilva YIM 90087]